MGDKNYGVILTDKKTRTWEIIHTGTQTECETYVEGYCGTRGDVFVVKLM